MRYVVLAMLIVLGCGNLAAVQAGVESERESFRGLPGVAVVIEGLDPAASGDGLSEDEIRTAVELILRSSGIRILSQTERTRFPAGPYLYVAVNTFKNKLGFYAYSASSQLSQVVELLSPGWKKQVYAVTWSRTMVGTVGQDKLRMIISVAIEPLVKEFANDFLTVNPR